MKKLVLAILGLMCAWTFAIAGDADKKDARKEQKALKERLHPRRW